MWKHVQVYVRSFVRRVKKRKEKDLTNQNAIHLKLMLLFLDNIIILFGILAHKKTKSSF